MASAYTKVEHHNSHSEFFNFIESFPNQRKVDEHPGHLPEHQVALDHLRRELVDIAKNPKHYEDKVCFRTCFKWQQRDYIQYCLDQKCGGADFNGAAKVLGYSK